MTHSTLDRTRYVLGDVSDHLGFLNCEQLSERSHIHGWKVEPHYHEGLLQLFVFGEGDVDARIDDRARLVRGPALIWLPALCSHGFDYPADMFGWVITVPTVDLARMTRDRPWLSNWIGRAQSLEGAAQQATLAEAEQLARQIEREHRREGAERDLALESLFALLLVCLHRGLAEQAGATPARDDRQQRLVTLFQERLDQHLQRTRSVADYADMLAITPTHLSRSVKAVTGRTAGELIHFHLLLEAKRRLVFSDMPVSDIAYELQFSSPSYFSRFFAARTGETPRAFRERMRS